MRVARGVIAGLVLVGCASEAKEPEGIGRIDAVETSTSTTVPRVEMSAGEFEQIQTGMSLAEVEAIVGGPGTLMAETEMAGFHSTIYMWEGDGVGANATVQFMNDEVVTKAQFGLTAEGPPEAGTATGPASPAAAPPATVTPTTTRPTSPTAPTVAPTTTVPVTSPPTTSGPPTTPRPTVTPTTGPAPTVPQTTQPGGGATDG